MATYTIAGNVGGSAYSGAVVQFICANSDVATVRAIADSSGNFTSPSLTNELTYTIVASFAGYTFSGASVYLNGANVTGVNLFPTAV